MEETLPFEQKRAENCLLTVKKRWQTEDPEVFRKYATFARELPLAILRGGLGMALARLISSSKQTQSRQETDERAYGLLYEDLAEWLTRDEPDAPYWMQGQKEDLLNAVMNGDRKQYRLAISEAIAWLSLHYQLTSIYQNRERGNQDE
ncbi:MAG: type III-B CRISPR module-associated protein Cmr5 [Thermoactinomyces sp.]